MGRESEREKWTFSVIEHLFDEMRVDQASYVLFGHSAGIEVSEVAHDGEAMSRIAADTLYKK